MGKDEGCRETWKPEKRGSHGIAVCGCMPEGRLSCTPVLQAPEKAGRGGGTTAVH